MIDQETRQKLIRELEKNGNVYLACLKVNIDRSTFYRWREQDAAFKKKADKATRTGRENNCDIAEHALMISVKEKKMEAIKYVLSHSSPRYKPKPRKVYIEHSNSTREILERTTEEEKKKIEETRIGLKQLFEDIRKNNELEYADEVSA